MGSKYFHVVFGGIVAVLFLMPVISICASGSGMLRLDYTVVENGTNAQHIPQSNVRKKVEFIGPGGEKRTEEIDPQDGHVVKVTIQIPDHDKFIEIEPKSKTAVVRYGSISRAKIIEMEPNGSISRAKSGIPMPGSTFGPIAAQKQDKGTVIIEGFTCRKYRDVVPNMSAVEFSLCKDPSSHQTFMGSIEWWGKDGATISPSSTPPAWRQILDKVTPNAPVNNDLFEIPPGYVTTRK